MQDLPLLSHSDVPAYNIKAVVLRTGIPAATLRAWERRYGALLPRRSQGNYRLYSDRDVAVLRWLKMQIDSGLSISRAVGVLEQLRGRAEAGQPVAGDAEAPVIVRAARLGRNTATPHPEGWERLRADLHAALVRLDEEGAGAIMAEATALYSVEHTCTHLVTPVLVQIGSDWHTNRLPVTTEHFATHFVLGRLLALFNSLPVGSGDLILVGCAPGERHEVGPLMVALLLRRRGFNVRYLGGDIPAKDWARVIMDQKPTVVAISATGTESARSLAQIRDPLRGHAFAGTQFILGGQALAGESDIANQFSGDYVGSDIMAGIAKISQLVGSGPH